MIEEYCIYVLINPEGNVFYVGQSKRLQMRIGYHREVFGADISYKIIENITGTLEEALKREEFWIKKYKKGGCQLVNVCHAVETNTGTMRIGKELLTEIKIHVYSRGGKVRYFVEEAIRSALKNDK